MQIQRHSLKVMRILLDLSCVTTAYIIGAVFSLKNVQFESVNYLLFLLFVSIVIWFIFSNSTDLYDEFRSKNFSFEIIAIVKNLFLTTVTLIIFLFLMRETIFSRYFIMLFAIISGGLLITERFIFRQILNYLRIKGRNLRNILIVGAGEVGKNFYDTIHENPHFGYRLIGFLDDEIKTFLNGQYLGTIDELDNVLCQKRIDDVIVALPNYATDRLDWVISTCERYTTRVKIIPDYFKFVSDRFDITLFGNFPVISVRSDKINEFHWRMIKRLTDISITSLSFIFLFSWLFPIIALIIKLDSKGPVFFKQERWGRDNKKFLAYKFRSMQNSSSDIDENGKYQQARKNDPRITKVGAFLRKTNLDELPQFINVLLGEMSLVGPRPHPTPLNLESKDKIRYYMLRHLVKPGITGWAQINGARGETSKPAQMQKRVELDLWYIENWSLWLDIQIILLTVWGMIKGDKQAY